MSSVAVGRRSAAQAAQAKQKKILIGGAVLLGIVLVIQVPRTMGMMKGDEAAAPAPLPTIPVSPVPVTPTTPGATPVTAAAPGKLVSFERFRSKDPFAQQVSADSGSSAPVKTTASTTAGTTSGGSTTASGGTKTATSAPTAFQSSGTGGTTAAKLEINGVEETIAAAKSFPKADPVFKLVSVSADSIEIAIADGSFKSGGKTITLDVGESMTLMNTADGKRYKLRLVSTS